MTAYKDNGRKDRSPR
ncbi:unnamed protein product, partial [Rotaria sp. Silwood1]